MSDPLSSDPLSVADTGKSSPLFNVLSYWAPGASAATEGNVTNSLGNDSSVSTGAGSPISQYMHALEDLRKDGNNYNNSPTDAAGQPFINQAKADKHSADQIAPQLGLTKPQAGLIEQEAYTGNDPLTLLGGQLQMAQAAQSGAQSTVQPTAQPTTTSGTSP